MCVDSPFTAHVGDPFRAHGRRQRRGRGERQVGDRAGRSAAADFRRRRRVAGICVSGAVGRWDAARVSDADGSHAAGWTAERHEDHGRPCLSQSALGISDALLGKRDRPDLRPHHDRSADRRARRAQLAHVQAGARLDRKRAVRADAYGRSRAARRMGLAGGEARRAGG